MLEIQKKDKAEIENSTVYKVQSQTPRTLYYPIESTASDYFTIEFVSKVITHHRTSLSEICTNSLVLEILKDSFQPGAKILHVGCRTGYLLACFLRLVRADYTYYPTDNTLIVGLTKEENGVEEIKKNLYNDDPTFLRHGEIIVSEGEYSQGCPQHAPFDAIFVSVSPSRRPSALLSQLAPGGRMLLCMMPLDSEPYLLQFDKHLNGTVASKRLMTLMMYDNHLHSLRSQLNNYFD